jgi:hypothetical protein
MDNVNVRIEVKTAIEIKSWIDQGYRISTLELLKGTGKFADIYFLKLVPKGLEQGPFSAAVIPETEKPSRSLVPGTELYKDGDAEAIEAKEPMPVIVKKGKTKIAKDPNRQNLAGMVEEIVNNNKAANLAGKALKDKCVEDIKAKKFPGDVEMACTNYLSNFL